MDEEIKKKFDLIFPYTFYEPWSGEGLLATRGKQEEKYIRRLTTEEKELIKIFEQLLNL